MSPGSKTCRGGTYLQPGKILSALSPVAAGGAELHARFHITKLSAMGVSAVFAAALILVAGLLPGHILIALLTAAVAAATAWWWLYHFEILRRTQTPTEYQAVAPVFHSLVPPSAVDRVRHHLLDGEAIHDIRRKSVWHLVRQVRYELLVILALLVLTVPVGFHLNPLHSLRSPSTSVATTPGAKAHKAKPDPTKAPVIKPPAPGLVKVPTVTFHWWYLLLVTLIPVYLMYRKWLYWASWFIIYTRDRLLVVVEPFAIYPFYKPMMDDEFPMTGALRVKIEVQGNTYAKKWGKADFSVATIYSEEEEASIRDIVGLPDPDGLKALIDNDIRERSLALAQAQEEHEREAAERTQRLMNGLEKVVDSNRELTEAIRRRRL